MAMLYMTGPCVRPHPLLEALLIFAQGGVCTRMAACQCGRKDGACPHPPVE